MRIIRDLISCPKECKNAALALGNFDGVHLGHQAILKEAIAIARANNKPSAVMTFEPHPREFFGKNAESLKLYSLQRKLFLLKELGIDCVFLQRFNAAFASITARDFIDEVLHEKLRVSHVITGQDFFFGQNRQGNREMLAKEASRLQFGFTAHPPVYDAHGRLISSSAIREALKAGEIAGANAMLGRRYIIEGRVIRGNQMGTKLGVPTANLSLRGRFKPRFGVYAARMNGEDAVASLGIRPTVGADEPLLEVHSFAKHQELYGQKIEVELVEFMRDEEKFPDLETLKKHMQKDCDKAKIILSGKS